MHPEYPFKSNFITIGGNRLHYIDEGQGEVVVMVHGNPTWSFYYRNLISLLKGNHRVIALDNMGCGLSDKPQDYDYKLANHIANLDKLLNKLAIQKFSLVVHDWGGAIGFGYAVNHVDRISSLVVHNTAAFRSTRIPLRIRLCKIPGLGEILVRGLNGFAWPATFMAVEKPLDSATKKEYTAPYNTWANRIAVHRFVKDIPLNQTHPSYMTLVEIEEKLHRIKDQNVPMLVLWGGKDFCFTKHFYQEWIKRFPQCQYKYYNNYGHYLLEDGKNEVLPRIQRFFA